MSNIAQLNAMLAPGTSGNVMTSNGTSWVSSAGSGGSPASPSGSFQFNNSGAFGGGGVTTPDGAGNCMAIAGDGVHDSLDVQDGSGNDILAVYPLGVIMGTNGGASFSVDLSTNTAYISCGSYSNGIVVDGDGNVQISCGRDSNGIVVDGDGNVQLGDVNEYYKGPVTVSVLNGQITNYAGEATAGVGLVPIYKANPLTGKTTSLASALTYTPTATGTFVVGGIINVTAVPGAPITITVQAAYTDETNTAVTGDQLLTLTAAAPGRYRIPLSTIWSYGANAITLSTTKSGAGTCTYDISTFLLQVI